MDKRTFLKLSSVLAAGSLLPASLSCKQSERQHNWAGNLVYGTDNYSEPPSIDDVRNLVLKNDKIKTLGTKHSFNTIADSKDNLMSLRSMQSMQIDKETSTVTVGAGVRYGTLSEYLQKNGYALHNLASLPHISVVGACATATHGSGVGNKNLSSAVTAFEFLSANGEVIAISKGRDGERFNGAVVHLGALGVITKITLEIQPTYNVRQVVYENLPLSALKDNSMEILSAGYSVSLFTDWKDHQFNEVWIKSIVEDDKPFQINPEFFGAKAATKNLHPVKAQSAESCTDQMGVPGPWHERLPHFKMNFTPSSGEELQAEYFVALEDGFEALSAIDQLGSQIYPHLFISEIRTIDGDHFWMSPCYHKPSMSIHFTWKPDWASVSKLLPLIEEALLPFKPKPHWAKLFTMDAGHLKSLYEDRLVFTKLCSEFDPGGKFRNEFLLKNVF